MGVIVLLTGFATVVAGLFLLFGPWALVACGAVAMAAGVLADWEAMTHEPAHAPPE